MNTFNGLNGTIMLNSSLSGIPAGTVDGEPYGYGSNLSVTVDLRLEREERQPEYETIEHTTVTQPLSFALTTSVWRPDRKDIVSGGATVQPLRDLVRYSNGFTRTTATQLADLGDRWHLNAMKAGCAHQTVVWEDKPYRRPSLDLTQPCPVTGYRYGSKWLVEELPEGFVEDLNAILRSTDQSRIYRHPDLG